MATLRIILLSFLFLFTAAGTGLAAEYNVCVNPDSTTQSDLGIIQGFLTNGLDEEASPTIRRITMGAVGEMGASLNNGLVGNRLILSDGSEISLVEGDTLIAFDCRDINKEHVRIGFSLVDHTPPGQICCKLHCQPTSICHIPMCPSWPACPVKMCTSIPPKKKF